MSEPAVVMGRAIFAGIDPDHAGAVVGINASYQVVFHEHTPVIGAKEKSSAEVIDGAGVLACLLRLVDLCRERGAGLFVVLERQMPARKLQIDKPGPEGVISTLSVGGSPGTAFKQGRAFQAWEQTLICLGISYEVHTPQRIQRELEGIEGGNSKERSVRFVQGVLPGLQLLPTKRHRKPHQGTADAGTTAVHALREWMGNGEEKRNRRRKS